MSTTLMPNYARLPITFTKGQGAWLWDANEVRYLDALAGIAVCGLGHAHPAIAESICNQAKILIHTSNIYGIAHQQTLADVLVRISGMETVFFCNSGAEANETALKIARLYGHRQGIETPTVIVMEGAFHGRTLATLTATGNPKVQKGFAPLMPGFIRVPYNNVEAIANAAQDHVVAVLVEPVQGEGGVIVPHSNYLNEVRTLCDQRGWLLMLDEVQTGVGRTGHWFAYQHNGILPDVVTSAKGLGNGVPIGACLARGQVATILQSGSHASTFGGNPLACCAALATIDTIERENLLAHVEQIGHYLHQSLVTALGKEKGVQHIRAKGLMIGIELDRSCGQLVTVALTQRLLINVTAERVIRLLPPLIINTEQADMIVMTLSRIIHDYLRM